MERTAAPGQDPVILAGMALYNVLSHWLPFCIAGGYLEKQMLFGWSLAPHNLHYCYCIL